MGTEADRFLCNIENERADKILTFGELDKIAKEYKIMNKEDKKQRPSVTQTDTDQESSSNKSENASTIGRKQWIIQHLAVNPNTYIGTEKEQYTENNKNSTE